MSTPELTLGTTPRIGRRTRIRRRFFRRPMAVGGLVLALLFGLMAIFAPLIAPYSPGETDFAAPLAGPSADHLLGADELGRDTFSRIVYGARASMQVGVLSTALAMLVGVPLGLIAGYFRGWSDPVISRVTDVLLAFPFIVVAVGLAAIYGASLTNATIALGFSAMPGIVRVTRGETLAVREEDFVRAAVANGAGDAVILRRHILPNLTSTLLVQATVTIPLAILGEALLSFLGLGVQPPTPSWGVMLSAAQPLLSQAPMLGDLAGHRGRARDALVQPARRRPARRPRPPDDTLMALLEVDELSVRFDSDEGAVHAVDRVSFSLAGGRGARDGRRVGLRQERDGDVTAAAAAGLGDAVAAPCASSDRDLLAPTRRACATCGGARSPSSSRSR